MSSTNETGLLTLSRQATGSAVVPRPRSRWLSRYVLPLGIIGVTLGLLGYAARSALWPSTPVRVVRVVSKAVQVENGGSSAGVVAQAAGWVEADPFPVHVSALAGGVVREVLVLEGQTVTSGQVVARLVDDDARLGFQKAEAELALRRADLANAQATSQAARSNWENPVDRDRAVAVAGAMLAEARAQVAAADAAVAEGEAKLAEARDQDERLAKLGGIASDVDARQAHFRLEAQKAALETARRQREVAASRVAAADAELKAATRNLELRIAERQAVSEGEAKVAQAQAAVNLTQTGLAEAKLRLDRMDIVSPVTGTVMQRTAAPGMKVMLDAGAEESAQIVHVYDPAKLQVRVDVPLADAAKIGVGQHAKVIVEVLPDQEFDGEVTRIVHQADIQKNTLQVKVAIHNPVAQLKPEMLARVKFLGMATGATAGVASGIRVFAPQQVLLQRNGSSAAVWLVDPTGAVAHRKAVTLGSLSQDGWIDVLEGLQPGDVLIAEPMDRISDGQKVKITGEAAVTAPAVPAAAKEKQHGSH